MNVDVEAVCRGTTSKAIVNTESTSFEWRFVFSRPTGTEICFERTDATRNLCSLDFKGTLCVKVLFLNGSSAYLLCVKVLFLNGSSAYLLSQSFCLCKCK